MDNTERAVAYRRALAGLGQGNENALARACAAFDSPGTNARAEQVWEGALLAGVPSEKIEAVAAIADWPALAVLADLAGEDPESPVVRYNREAWGAWTPPAPGTTSTC